MQNHSPVHSNRYPPVSNYFFSSQSHFLFFSGWNILLCRIHFYFALDLFEPLFLFFMLPLSRILPMDVIFLTACGTIMLWFYTGLYLCGLIRVLKVNTLLETENKDSFLFAKRVLSFLLKGIFGIAYSIPVLVVIAISLHHACHLVDMLIPLELYEAWGWNIENLF